jgi:S-formylglutathione hydrolase
MWPVWISEPRRSDLPYKGDELQPAVVAKWAANAPLAMIDQYIANLRKLHASTVRTLDQILTSYSIPHEFAIYPGTHVSGIADRVETKTLPFFSKNLAFATGTH